MASGILRQSRRPRSRRAVIWMHARLLMSADRPRGAPNDGRVVSRNNSIAPRSNTLYRATTLC